MLSAIRSVVDQAGGTTLTVATPMFPRSSRKRAQYACGPRNRPTGSYDPKNRRRTRGNGTSMTLLSVVNGLVFDSSTGELSEHPVHVADGRIVALEGSPPSEARVIDAQGGLVTPGLIDAHFHAYAVSLDMAEMESLPMSYVATKAAHRLRRALERGFTTVRDVAGGDLGLQQALEEGLVPGPRYFFTGRALTQTGGHGDPRPAHSMVKHDGGLVAEIVDGVDNLRAAVRERLRGGAHAIKIFTSGGVVSPADPLRVPQYSAEEVRAVTDEATRRGSYVAAHAYSPEAILHSVGNGVRTVEHGNLLDTESAAAMARAGAYLVPTLVTYDSMRRRGADLGLPPVSQEKNLEVLEAGLGSIEIARAADVSIGLGSDLVGDLEDDQLHEFRIRSEVESVTDMLRSVTAVNAEIIGRSDLGIIAEGATADLVVFDHNPFEKPSVLWEGGRTVVAEGRVV